MATTLYESEADDDLMSQAATPARKTSPAPTQPTESQFVAPEVAGDPPVALPDYPTESEAAEGAADDEVGNAAGAEADEEFVEATPAQLTASFGEESALSDLQGIEGFEGETLAEEFGEEAGAELEDVGAALAEGVETADAEFGFLASLVPTLVSTVGPALAKAVGKKLRPRTRRRVARRAKQPRRAGGGKKDRILALIAKLLESAESMPATESDVGLDEGVVDETVQAIESIIGTDDRVRITQTTNVPWRRICALRIHFRTGRIYRGTGFLIGARAIATAGHCVYLHSQGGWAQRIEVIPGANGTSRPFGMAVSTHFRSVRGWVVSRKPASDYGCIVLPNGAFGGRNLGAFGFAAWGARELVAHPAVLAGYPGDKPFAEMWGMSRRIKSVSSEQLHYDIDTMGGQSGAPVYIKRNGQRYCVGIHNYGGGRSNTATRITQGVYRRLSSWRQL